MLNEQSLVRAFKTLIVDKLADIVDLIVVGSTLEPATATKLGGVKIGTGVNVAEDGTISVDTPAPAPTGWTLIGDVSPDVFTNFPSGVTDLLFVVHDTSGNQKRWASGLIPFASIPGGYYSQYLHAGGPDFNFVIEYGQNGGKLITVKAGETDVKAGTKVLMYYK